MTRPLGCTAAQIRALAARTVLMLGAAMLALSGCACERPERGAARGPGPLTKAEPPLVRVKLGDDASSVAVAVGGPWTLTADSREVASGESLEWTDVTFGNGQIAFGSLATVAGPVELRGKTDGSIWIGQGPADKRRERSYRGTVRIGPTREGALRLINTLPMEDYLAGVVANELLKRWHVEAYKAQAVAARTFALMSHNARTRYDFDVYDSTSSQVYGGRATETTTAWAAVNATWGIVATYIGPDRKRTMLRTYYHSTCGGDTVPSGSVFGGATPPPLAGGTKCTYCRKSTKYQWPEVVLTKQEVTEALSRHGSKDLAGLGPLDRAEVVERSASGGRAQKIRLVGTSGVSVVVSANAWRVLIGARKVPSTWFDLEDRGDRIALTNGRGYGHGVGLCQWGAQFLAERGKTGEEILRYYYPKVELVRAY